MLALVASDAVAETSTDSGENNFFLKGALGGCVRFKDVYASGDVIGIMVTDGSGQSEFLTATFTSPGMLVWETVIVSTNANLKISWPESGQRIIRPLALGPESQPYPIAMFVPGIMAEGSVDERMRVRIITTEDVDFVADFVGSVALVRVDPAGNTSFTVNKISGGVTTEIGQISFLLGETTGTFTSDGGTSKSLSSGDIIEVVGGATADTDLSDLSITFRGIRA